MTTYCQRIFPWIEKDAYRVESERGRGGRSDMTVSQSTLGVTNRVGVINGTYNDPEHIRKAVVRNAMCIHQRTQLGRSILHHPVRLCHIFPLIY